MAASMNIVLPLDASRACAWLLQDHIAITRAPMLDLTGEGDDDSFSSGTNDDEVGPNGTGGNHFVSHTTLYIAHLSDMFGTQCVLTF